MRSVNMRGNAMNYKCLGDVGGWLLMDVDGLLVDRWWAVGGLLVDIGGLLVGC